MNLIPSVLLGLAAAAFGYIMCDLKAVARKDRSELGKFEADRRARLRQEDSVYEWCEPWIDELTPSVSVDAATLVEQELRGAGKPDVWTGAEYLTVQRLQSYLVGAGFAVLGYLLNGAFGAVALGIAGLFGFPMLAKRSLAKQARQRRIRIKRRFAAMIDLMSIMMEVGGGIDASLRVVADQSAGHPLGFELRRMLDQMDIGIKRTDAFRSFDERITDDDISELVTAIVEGERLGTPLADILKVQADQIRRKRSQWAEKAAAESQVALVGPAMIIMIACLIAVVGPFILNAYFVSGS